MRQPKTGFAPIPRIPLMRHWILPSRLKKVSRSRLRMICITSHCKLDSNLNQYPCVLSPIGAELAFAAGRLNSHQYFFPSAKMLKKFVTSVPSRATLQLFVGNFASNPRLHQLSVACIVLMR